MLPLFNYLPTNTQFLCFLPCPNLCPFFFQPHHTFSFPIISLFALSSFNHLHASFFTVPPPPSQHPDSGHPVPAGAASSEVLLQLSPGPGSRRHPGPAPDCFCRLYFGGFHFGHATASVIKQCRAGPGVLLHSHLHLDHRASYHWPLHRCLPPAALPHGLLPSSHTESDIRRVHWVFALCSSLLLVAWAVAQPSRNGQWWWWRRRRGRRRRQQENRGRARPGVGPLCHRLPPALHRLLLPQRCHRAQVTQTTQLFPSPRLLYGQDHRHSPRHHLHFRCFVGTTHPHDPLPLLLTSSSLARRRPTAPHAHWPGEHASVAQHRRQLFPLLFHQQAIPGHGCQRAESAGPLPEAASAVLRQPQLLHHEQSLDLTSQLPLHQDVGVPVRQKWEAHLYFLLSLQPPAAAPALNPGGRKHIWALSPLVTNFARMGLFEAWKCQHARRAQRW